MSRDVSEKDLYLYLTIIILTLIMVLEVEVNLNLLKLLKRNTGKHCRLSINCLKLFEMFETKTWIEQLYRQPIKKWVERVSPIPQE